MREIGCDVHTAVFDRVFIVIDSFVDSTVDSFTEEEAHVFPKLFGVVEATGVDVCKFMDCDVGQSVVINYFPIDFA